MCPSNRASRLIPTGVANGKPANFARLNCLEVVPTVALPVTSSVYWRAHISRHTESSRVALGVQNSRWNLNGMVSSSVYWGVFSFGCRPGSVRNAVAYYEKVFLDGWANHAEHKSVSS
jgi:hypothetical protein